MRLVGSLAEFKIYSALIGYDYPFSKRTDLYIGAGMTCEKDRITSGSTTKSRTHQAILGIAHQF
jgi:predicted porin